MNKIVGDGKELGCCAAHPPSKAGPDPEGWPALSGVLAPQRPSKWDERFLDMASEVSSWSKDGSSQVGAVLVGAGREPLSFAYNGFCRGIDEAGPERHQRPAKYDWTEHAERNAMWNLARRVLTGGRGREAGLVLHATEFPSCDGARAVIQSGICKLIVPPAALERAAPLALEMLGEAQVAVVACPLSPAAGGVVAHQPTPASRFSVGPVHWAGRFLSLGKRASSWSKTDAPAGAVLIDAERTPISFGYDGLPRGLDDADPRWAATADLVEEAVQNAILNAIRPHLAGSTLYSTHFPCIRCARATIQSGVSRVVSDFDRLDAGFAARWRRDMEVSSAACVAAGLEVIVAGRGA